MALALAVTVLTASAGALVAGVAATAGVAAATLVGLLATGLFEAQDMIATSAAPQSAI